MKKTTKKHSKKISASTNKSRRTNKTIKKDEFRKHKKSGHPAYIYEKQGSNYKFLGITHAKKTQNVKNIELHKNPNPKDLKKSYVRPKPQCAKESKFKKRLFGWFFSDEDKKTINKLKK